MPTVGGAGSPSTHVQEMPVLSPGGFSSEKDKLLVHTILGPGRPLHPGQRGSGRPAPRPVSEGKAINAHPSGQHKQRHLCRAYLSQSLPYIACADGPTVKVTVSVGVGRAFLLQWLPGGPQRVRSLFSSLV